MHYIYHAVPENMSGDMLLPLRKLMKQDDELARKYSEKYTNRAEIIEKRIEPLSCKWKDVVQFLPLDPMKVFALQKQMGFIDTIPAYKYYKIAQDDLDPNKTVVYFKTAPGEENAYYKWIKEVDFSKIRDVPKATLDYYESVRGTGEMPFNFQFIPHVMHAGPVDVSSAEIYTLGQN